MNRGRLAVLLCAFILSLVGISCFGGPVTYIFFWMVIAVPVISLLYILFVIVFIRFHQETDGRNMVVGSPGDFYITLQNDTPFSFSSLRIVFYSSFSTVDGIEPDAVYELPPKSVIKKTTRLVCRYRGEYKVGIKSISVEDFFGLFTVVWRISEPLSVIVEPAVIDVDRLPGDEKDEASRHENMTRRVDPSIMVREYSEGDDIRFISWKATAAMQKLMVREKTSEEKSDIMIVMDPKRYDEDMERYLPVENRMVELLLLLSSFYSKSFMPHDVMLFNEDVKQVSVRNVRDFDELYGDMVRYHFRQESSMEALLMRLYDMRAASSCHMLIFIVQSLTQDVLGLVDMINVDNVTVKIYTVGEETGDITLDPGRDVTVIPVSCHKDMKEALG